MSRILTLFLVLHWAVAFSILAALVLMSGEGALLAGFGLLADLSGSNAEILSSVAVRAAVGFGLAVCALLFWWAASVSMFSPGPKASANDETLKVAFAAASGMMTAILILGTIAGAYRLFPAIAAHFTALIASYLVARSEQQPGTQLFASNDQRVSVRMRAMHASQTDRVARFVTKRDSKRSFDR
jgi:hypothetical protein